MRCVTFLKCTFAQGYNLRRQCYLGKMKRRRPRSAFHWVTTLVHDRGLVHPRPGNSQWLSPWPGHWVSEIRFKEKSMGCRHPGNQRGWAGRASMDLVPSLGAQAGGWEVWRHSIQRRASDFALICLWRQSQCHSIWRKQTHRKSSNWGGCLSGDITHEHMLVIPALRPLHLLWNK